MCWSRPARTTAQSASACLHRWAGWEPQCGGLGRRPKAVETKPYLPAVGALAPVHLMSTHGCVPPETPLPPLQKSKLKVTRFLNRLLGMSMTDQELLFQVGEGGGWAGAHSPTC